jgi:hypothetical protein
MELKEGWMKFEMRNKAMLCRQSLSIASHTHNTPLLLQLFTADAISEALGVWRCLICGKDYMKRVRNF